MCMEFFKQKTKLIQDKQSLTYLKAQRATLFLICYYSDEARGKSTGPSQLTT